MAEKLTEEELVTRIRGEITDSLGYMGDTSLNSVSRLCNTTMRSPSETKWKGVHSM